MRTRCEKRVASLRPSAVGLWGLGFWGLGFRGSIRDISGFYLGLIGILLRFRG